MAVAGAGIADRRRTGAVLHHELLALGVAVHDLEQHGRIGDTELAQPAIGALELPLSVLDAPQRSERGVPLRGRTGSPEQEQAAGRYHPRSSPKHHTNPPRAACRCSSMPITGLAPANMEAAPAFTTGAKQNR